MHSFPYLPLSETDRKEMLDKLGFSSFQELIDRAVPKDVHCCGLLPIPEGISEIEAEAHMAQLAAKNRASAFVTFAGAGAYDMYVPASIDELSNRPEFYTAYTPYQPEVSQGTLTAIFQFQSMMTRLTGMEVCNASMYDGASAAAEAAILSIHQTGRKKILYSEGLNPFYIDVIRTYLHGFDVELVPVPLKNGCTDAQTLENLIDENTACFMLQNPNFFGIVENGFAYADVIHAKGALFVTVVADALSFGKIVPPGEYGADVCAGEAQQFGNYISFGGPYIGFLAAKKQFIRAMPGRIIGMTKDIEGKRAFTMIFQTREQHIRRAKATSNICSNQQLCGLRASIYLALVGKHGLEKLSNLVCDRAHYAADKLCAIKGVKLLFDAPFYREFAIQLPCNANRVVELCCEDGVLAGVPVGRYIKGFENILLVALSDKTDSAAIDMLVNSIEKNITKVGAR